MSILVGFVPGPEGLAAVERAIVEARAHGEDLVAVNVAPVDASGVTSSTVAAPTRGHLRDIEAVLEDSGVVASIRTLAHGMDAADEIDSIVHELDVSLVVIGIRRRTAVGKLLMGSNSQKILLQVDSPVLAVKAPKATS